MGSYNTKCAISNCPISSGDKVRLFFAVSNQKLENNSNESVLSNQMPYRGQGSSSLDLFKVLGFGMKAQYDDCNIFELIDEDDIISQYNINVIKQHYFKIENGDIYTEELVNINKDDLNFDIINQMIRDGLLYLKDNNGVRFVTFIPVREEIYQVLMSDRTYVYSSNGSGYKTLPEYKSYLLEKIESSKDQRKESYDRWVVLLSKLVGTEYKGSVFTEEDVHLVARSNSGIETSSTDTDVDCTEYSYKRSSSIDALDLFKKSSNEEENYESFEEALALQFFIYVLFEHKLPFVPSPYSGQDNDTFSHGAFMVKMGEALMQTAIDDGNIPVPEMTVPDTALHFNIRDIEDYFYTHWSSDRKSAGLKAVHHFKMLFGNCSTKLSYNDAIELKLVSLFDVADNIQLPIYIHPE